MSSTRGASKRRSSGRKRTQPDTLTYGASGGGGGGGGDAAQAKSPSASRASAKRPRQASKRSAAKAPGRARTGKAAGQSLRANKAHRPDDERARAMIGKCIRIDWPVGGANEVGEYTAMVFAYVPATGTHKLFYYATADTGEACEDVDLYDGTRVWTKDWPPGAPERPARSGLAQVPDPRNLIGRRVRVYWPNKVPGRKKLAFDAVIVDMVTDSEFRIVYVDDEWVENRDLIASELPWELYPPHEFGPARLAGAGAGKTAANNGDAAYDDDDDDDDDVDDVDGDVDPESTDTERIVDGCAVTRRDLVGMSKGSAVAQGAAGPQALLNYPPPPPGPSSVPQVLGAGRQSARTMPMRPLAPARP
jgi:hypothetical protein